MKIVICEDEKRQRNLIRKSLSTWAMEKGISCNVLEYEKSEELLFKEEEHRDADLYILDIEMQGINGMELAKKIRAVDRKVGILFITGYENFVFSGYEVNAIAYLLKPYKQENLFYYLDEMRERMEDKRQFFMMGSNGDCQKVYLEDILYFESNDHQIRVVTRNNEIIHRETMEDLKTKLPQTEFCQCHRSYLVHLSKILRITKKEVLMGDNCKIPIARGKWELLNESYLNYFRGIKLW